MRDRERLDEQNSGGSLLILNDCRASISGRYCDFIKLVKLARIRGQHMSLPSSGRRGRVGEPRRSLIKCEI